MSNSLPESPPAGELCDCSSLFPLPIASQMQKGLLLRCDPHWRALLMTKCASLRWGFSRACSFFRVHVQQPPGSASPLIALLQKRRNRDWTKLRKGGRTLRQEKRRWKSASGIGRAAIRHPARQHQARVHKGDEASHITRWKEPPNVRWKTGLRVWLNVSLRAPRTSIETYSTEQKVLAPARVLYN